MEFCGRPERTQARLKMNCVLSSPDAGSLSVPETIIGGWWKPGKGLGIGLGQCTWSD